MKIGSARILVLSAEPYKYTSKKTGEIVDGVTIWYCSGGGKDKKTGKLGAEPVKATLDEAEFKNLSAVPGWYDADLYMVTEQVTKYQERQTVQTVVPQDLQYVAALIGPPAPGAIK